MGLHEESQYYFYCVDTFEGRADDLRDFKPVSLMGSLYKLLAKVLADMLKKIVEKVFSEAHITLVEGC